MEGKEDTGKRGGKKSFSLNHFFRTQENLIAMTLVITEFKSTTREWIELRRKFNQE